MFALSAVLLIFTTASSINIDGYHCPKFVGLDKKIDDTNGVRVNLQDAMNNHGIYT